MRAEFSEKVKRTLAARVSYRCSFAGCGRSTVGPKTESDDSVILLGDAAHIYAASEGGPRPNPTMTTEERASINNGIWMCKGHARLIDVDEINYSAETLLLWKQKAEKDAYFRLKGLEKDETNSLETFISLSNIIFSGTWLSSIEDKWTFEVDSFLAGNIEQLRSVCNDFDELPLSERYIIVESQGDGRQVGEVSWKISESKKYQVTCSVLPKLKRIDPNSLGEDIALSEDFDLVVKEEDGDFAVVQGIDSAIQSIRLALSSGFGDFKEFPSLGCYFPNYYSKYKNNVLLLNRLLKIEVIRLLTVPMPDSSSIRETAPVFDFINRILNVEIKSVIAINDQIPVKINLEWGNLKTWSGVINIYVAGKTLEELADQEDFWAFIKTLNTKDR